MRLRPVVAWLLVTFSAFCFAQQQSPNESGDHLVVSVDVVNVYFNVRDPNGNFVKGLQQKEFALLEDGKPQKVRYFAAESQIPLRIALLIDSSGSQDKVFRAEKNLAADFLKNVLQPDDEAMVVSFDSGVQMRRDFTHSADKLRDSLEATQRVSSTNSPELGAIPKYRRSTALYDAIQLTSNQRMARTLGRKVMIVLTDGEDQGSRVGAEEAMNAALRANTICYVLLIADSQVRSSPSYRGEERMKALAQSTGGRLIKVSHNLEKMEREFAAITLELRNHYSIGYTPVNRLGRGEYRKLQVRSRRGYKIQARDGYFAKFPGSGGES